MDESGFSHVDSAQEPSEYVRRLDVTGSHPFWQSAKERVLALLALQDGSHVLDVGCGTGDDVRVLAGKVGRQGRAVGIDVSATMVAEAIRRSQGLDLPVEFYSGDVCNLDFSDESFDGCRAERVLQHVSDPGRAIWEMVRVLRSGGRLAAAEPDYGAAVLASGDPNITGKILECRCRHFRSGRIGRDLPALFKDAKLQSVSVAILLATQIGTNESEWQRVLTDADRARRAGVISSLEMSSWLSDLERAAEAGSYRRVIPVFIAAGQKS